MELFADPVNSATLTDRRSGEHPIRRSSTICALISTALRAGDYFALLAYHREGPRPRVRCRRLVAACETTGAWPRASGSDHVSCTPPDRRTRADPTAASSCRSPPTTARISSIPGYAASFGVVKAAQARGDFQVLAERKRRLLRLHLGANLDAGLATLDAAFDALFSGEAR